MYVCNCNGVTRTEVDEAIAAGAQGPEAVLAHHGCEPCCGRCLPEIADRLSVGGIACGGTARDRSLVAAE
jgi:bacterioferritin-associated ferredoxin